MLRKAYHGNVKNSNIHTSIPLTCTPVCFSFHYHLYTYQCQEFLKKLPLPAPPCWWLGPVHKNRLQDVLFPFWCCCCSIRPERWGVLRSPFRRDLVACFYPGAQVHEERKKDISYAAKKASKECTWSDQRTSASVIPLATVASVTPE